MGNLGLGPRNRKGMCKKQGLELRKMGIVDEEHGAWGWGEPIFRCGKYAWLILEMGPGMCKLKACGGNSKLSMCGKWGLVIWKTRG